MSVDTGIAGSTGEILAIAIRNMLTCLWFSESFGQAKVNDVNEMLLLADAYEEVVRLDVTMQEVARMDELKSLQL